tara:strand:- start:1166 stop:1438 length:273 start_codon:yes stop_codon:yes gene_type:complete
LVAAASGSSIHFTDCFEAIACLLATVSKFKSSHFNYRSFDDSNYYSFCFCCLSFYPRSFASRLQAIALFKDRFALLANCWSFYYLELLTS